MSERRIQSQIRTYLQTSINNRRTKLGSLDESNARSIILPKSRKVVEGRRFSLGHKIKKSRRNEVHLELMKYKQLQMKQKWTGRNTHIGSLLGIIRNSFDQDMSKKLQEGYRRRNLNRSIDFSDA